MAWWNFGDINNWGFYPDPEGNFAKPDINILAPAGTPFTAIAPGVITGMSTSASYGDVVTVRFDTPYNPIATHYAFLHLTSLNPQDFVGENVTTGEVLGWGGGGRSRSGADPGFALIDTAEYGTGSANEPFHGRYINPELNPTQILKDLRSGTPFTGSGKPLSSPFNIGQNGSATIANSSTGLGGIPGLNIDFSGLQAWATQAGIVVLGAVLIIVALILVFK